jgi:hypothetical protein
MYRSSLMFIAVAAAGAAIGQAQLQPTYLKIRIEKADRIIQPANGTSTNCYRGKDNMFNEIEVSTGVFYGYTANGFRNTNGANNDDSTCLIQGNQVYNMGGSFTGVIASGSPNDPNYAFASCGYWLNGTYKSGSTWYGFAHAEAYGNTTYGRYCGYPPTTKSMGLLTSTDGVNWTPQGQIIANPAENSGGSSPSEYGEGDCTPVPFSGYLYLYCRRTKDTKTSVARAPLSSNFGQSSWQKLTAPGTWGGSWNSDDYPLGLYGSSASIFGNYGNITLLRTELGGSGTAHGVQISFSGATDPTTFTSLSEPLIYEDLYQFPNASTSSDLIAYPSALSGTDGSRDWNGYFLLAYTWVPNQSDTEGAPDYGRTLAMRNVVVSQESTPQSPQVGIALSRWYSSSIDQRISTVEPVPYGFVSAGYSLEQPNSGFLMTVPPASGSNTVVECVSTASWPSAAHPDHLINAYATGSNPSNSGCDANYAFLRTAGYLYSSSQGSSTVPVYRCKPGTGSGGTTATHFASTQSDCEGLGTEEYLMGYALAN